MAALTPAAEALRKAIQPPVVPKVEDHADRIGVTKASLYAWLAGSSRPSLDARHRIADLYGIPVRAWLTPEELGEEPSDGAPEVAQ